MQNIDFQSRAIILTGAAGILGRAMALALLKAGHRVLLTDLDAAPLEAIASESGAETDMVDACAADLTEQEAADRLHARAIERFGDVDVLINNAAFTAFAAWPVDSERPDPWKMDADFVRRFFDVNVIAQHRLTSLLVPPMIARGWGRIVNITCSYDTMHRIFPYGATKAALEAYTGALDIRLKHTGVSANTLNPGGPVATQAHMANNPGRKWVDADVMNPAILWLASNASNGIEGRRYVGAPWKPQDVPQEALARASGPLAWVGFGDTALK